MSDEEGKDASPGQNGNLLLQPSNPEVPSILDKPFQQPTSDKPLQSIFDPQPLDQQPFSLDFTMDDRSQDDAEIDDPELMTTKRHLTTKHTPLTIIKSLQDKHRTISIEEETSQFKHAFNN